MDMTVSSQVEQAGSSQPVRHLHFYFDRGDDIFQVENTLYKLHRDFLIHMSEFFANLFMVPQPDGAVNGSSDDYPIILPDVKVSEFDNFLAWLHPTMSPEVEKTVRYWADVMRIADLYEVERAKEDAKKEIQSQVRFRRESPALVMSLAQRFQIREWFEYAFRTLISGTVLDISRDDAELIGVRCLLAIVKTQAYVQEFRRSFAFVPPKVSHSELHCMDRVRCTTAYENSWWLGVGRELLDPEYPTASLMLMGKIDSFRFDGMQKECWNLTRQNMNTAMFHEEEKIITNTLDCLLTSFHI